jgi:hypothetical protein
MDGNLLALLPAGLENVSKAISMGHFEEIADALIAWRPVQYEIYGFASVLNDLDPL